MKIDSSNIGMESARSYRASNATVRRFTITDYQENLTSGGNALNTTITNGENDEKETSAETADKNTTVLEEWENRYALASGKVSIRSSASTTITEIRQLSIRYIFDLLFAARRGKLSDWFSENGTDSSGTETESAVTGTAAGDTTAGTGMSLNNGTAGGISVLGTNLKVLNYTNESWQSESEETSFSTTGTVKTSDGREISFNVNVGMSREFEQYYRQDLEAATFQMCDPLVINMDTDVAELSDQTFYFDIDADGEKDEISNLGSGSGYLALDKNGDGSINDGSELFGTESGNGFADLAKYDEDGNGWIDENDQVWSKLQIWCKDENGKDMLYKLSEKGVGAICLQNVSTDFTLKNSDNQTKGAIRNTGVFLYENGNVGTVQHVDVAKYAKEA